MDGLALFGLPMQKPENHTHDYQEELVGQQQEQIEEHLEKGSLVFNRHTAPNVPTMVIKPCVATSAPCAMAHSFKLVCAAN